MNHEPTHDNYVVHLLSKLAERGERDAIRFEGQRITSEEARVKVLRLAAYFRAAGAQPGDGIALFSRNRPEVLLVKMAAHLIGCRLVFVPPQPGDDELGGYVEHAGIRVLVYDAAYAPRAARILARVDVPVALSLGEDPPRTDLAAWLATADGPGLDPAAAAPASDIATILYTGGSTGNPKLVMHHSRYYRGLLELSKVNVSHAADKKFLVCTELTHTSGHLSSLIGVMTGQTIVLMEEFDGARTLAVVAEEQITSMTVVPPMLYEILDASAATAPPSGPSTLQAIYYGGSSPAPSRIRQAIERFGPILHQFYGATEHAVVSRLAAEEHDLARPKILESCGRPVPGVEVEVRDNAGTRLGPGQVGELCVRGDMVMDGYWGAPDGSADSLADGWFKSGDLGYRDEDGYIYLVDRIKDIIIPGLTSDNVYSRLLDDFLVSLPEIRDAAAVGIPAVDQRETVHVFLVLADPAAFDFEDLRRKVTRQLGEIYEPKSYSAVSVLPRTNVGKVDKRELRARFVTACIV
jgi:fatty-acyl-CoA synthase